MFHRSNRVRAALALGGVLTLGLTIALGCGTPDRDRGEGGVDGDYDPTVKIVDLPPGADPAVSAEQGGAGFEGLAADQGWQTYEIPDEDLGYFGDPRAKKGGTLTDWVSRFPNTFRIIGQHSNYQENNTIGGMIYEGLLTLHPVTLEHMPALATHWKISDDQMTYWFRINPDARWSDGTRVTSDDVVVTWKLRMDKGILFPSSQLVFGKFEEPVAESPYIVRVTSGQLNWRNFLYFSGMAIMPAHKLRELAETNGVPVDSVGKFYLKEYQFKMLPGSGPYYVRQEDIKKQQSYAVTRRSDYWAADYPQNRFTGNFDKIRWVVIKDNERLPFEMLKKGDLDVYQVTRAQWWVEECNFDEIQKGYVQKRKVFSENPAGTSGYALNMRVPPFNDQRVRQAFRYLLNREKMIEELFFNEYIPLDSYYAGSVYENPNDKTYTYDPEKAIALLAEAGYKEKNGDGILLGPDGQPFQLEMGIVKSLERIITPFQQELRKVGIDLQLKFQDGNALWKMMMERKFKIQWVNWGGLVFPNPETSMNSALADQDENNNISGIKVPRIDELCDIYDREFSQARRVTIVREIDSLAVAQDALVMAWYAPFTRVLYWDRYGHPEWYFDRYNDQRAVYSFWWYDPDKDTRLKNAMEAGESLPVGPVDITYWPEYLKRERGMAQR